MTALQHTLVHNSFKSVPSLLAAISQLAAALNACGTVALLPVLSVKGLDCEGLVGGLYAKDCHGHTIRIAPWVVEGLHATCLAEPMLRNMSAKGVSCQLSIVAQQLESFRRHDEVGVSLHGTDAAVAVPGHKIRAGLRLKLDFAAVAGACVGLQLLTESRGGGGHWKQGVEPIQPVCNGAGRELDHSMSL